MQIITTGLIKDTNTSDRRTKRIIKIHDAIPMKNRPVSTIDVDINRVGPC